MDGIAIILSAANLAIVLRLLERVAKIARWTGKVDQRLEHLENHVYRSKH